MVIRQFIVLLIVLFFTVKTEGEELPRASVENCFYIMPLFEKLRVPGAMTYEEKRAQFVKMKEQLGEGNLYHRLGFSGIYAPSVDAQVRENCKLAQEYGVHLGLIFADQSHTRNDFRNMAAKDLRLFQWRKDGVDWKGAYVNSGTLEVAEDERDYKIPTPSRLATSLQDYNALQVKSWGEAVKRLMADYPNVITCINGPIEEELALGGASDPNKLGDYSPYAITEFRDWLRHKGIYDATLGKYHGEGANSLIVGNLIDFSGTLRSQFYDDSTPNDNNGTGISFNAFFGTDFTTWSLHYWDLELFPDKITDENFDCTPESGSGCTIGGFDAPRIINSVSKFWNAWSYDVPDHGGNYPPGNPSTPAYGFRQNMVRNFARDLFSVLSSIGLPQEIMYAHQIPSEALGNFTGAEGRNRSSASTVWTSYLEKSNSVGITRFGSIDPNILTQYADNWGIFEWHTAPNTDAYSQTLYDKSINDLNNYYKHKCHFLFPGWWKQSPDDDLRFPLNDSRFADAIGVFMQACGEVPYNQQGTVHDYSPPLVTGIYGYWVDDLLKVSWNEQIWSDLLPKWRDWSGFSHFEIQKSTDGINWGVAEMVTTNIYSQSLAPTTFKVRVRAVSKTALAGNWSSVVSIDENSSSKQFSLSPEFNSLEPNPDLLNRMTIKMYDPNQVINSDLLEISINGDGVILNSEPENRATIDKFWPMNSTSELTGVYKLDNALFSDGFFEATVSSTMPIDPYFSFSNSQIDGSKLPYISFKLYSDVATEGRLYWFIPGGNKSVIFDIKAGWNVYSISNLSDWSTQTVINSVRLDPGIDASTKIKLDWMAISSQPISETMKPAVKIIGNSATFLTSPTSNPGSYTVSVTLNGNKQDVIIQTQTVTVIQINPSLNCFPLIYPNPAKENVTINLQDSRKATISIHTLNGRLIKRYEFSAHEKAVFSVADLPKGIYILQVMCDQKIFTEKLIKQ